MKKFIKFPKSLVVSSTYAKSEYNRNNNNSDVDLLQECIDDPNMSFPGKLTSACQTYLFNWLKNQYHAELEESLENHLGDFLDFSSVRYDKKYMMVVVPKIKLLDGMDMWQFHDDFEKAFSDMVESDPDFSPSYDFRFSGPGSVASGATFGGSGLYMRPNLTGIYVYPARYSNVDKTFG